MVWISLATLEGREVKRKWLGMGITLSFDSMPAMTAAWNLGRPATGSADLPALVMAFSVASGLHRRCGHHSLGYLPGLVVDWPTTSFRLLLLGRHVDRVDRMDNAVARGDIRCRNGGAANAQLIAIPGD